MASATSAITTPEKKRRGLNICALNTSRMSEATFAYLLVAPLVLALLLLNAFPLLYSIWLSFHRIMLGRSSWQFVGAEQYTRALQDPAMWHSAWVTIQYTVATTVISFAISIGGALLLNEKFKARPILMILAILPWALSTYATAVLWRYIYSQQVGLLNALLGSLGLVNRPVSFLTDEFAIYAVAIAHAWQMAPFGIYFLLATLQVIPPDLYRVARIDRLGMLGRFRHVTLPYLMGPLLALAMLIILAAARIFDIIYFITTGGPGDASMTMTYQINVTTFKSYDIGYGSALSQFLLVLVLVAMVIYFGILMSQRKRGPYDHRVTSISQTAAGMGRDNSPDALDGCAGLLDFEYFFYESG